MNRHVAVIGGGASGALAAMRLLESLPSGDQVTLIGREPTPARGVAFGTQDLEHRLNVRAKNMSALSDRPSHFLDWLIGQGAGDSEVLAESFAARPIYAEYMTETLQDCVGRSKASFRFCRAEAVCLHKTSAGLGIGLRGRPAVAATHVVLALGHLGPKLPAPLRHLAGRPGFFRSSWEGSLADTSFHDGDVLIVGAGLTMVDTVMTIKNQMGKGTIYARSRRGLMPHPHRRGPKPGSILLDEPVESVRELAREIICRSRSAGPHWRSVVDGCRSQTSNWWKSLTWAERARFLRRLQPFWDAHRHRVPDEVYAEIMQMRIEMRLDVAPVRDMRVKTLNGGFELTGTRSDGTQETLYPKWVINCTGPETDYRAAKVPLLESAVEDGLAQYDPLGLGLMIDDRHATEPSARVFAIGPLCRGCLWETIAIPEIREQATLIALQCAE